jgi:four helix bundle protein
MSFSHEKLDVYRVAIEYVAWVYEEAAKLKGIHRPARDQWLRASQSIPLNIAEGYGKTTEPDRRRFFEIARGSALECAAIQDVLVVGEALGLQESRRKKAELDRIVAMLSRLGGRGYVVNEEEAEYGSGKIDTDSDPDTDSDGTAGDLTETLARSKSVSVSVSGSQSVSKTITT